MNQPSRGEIEDSLASAIIRFEKEHLGRGPTDARAYILQDMILIRLRGVLTPAEIKLAQTPDGHALVKQVRTQLIESSRSLLEEIVLHLTGTQLVSLHSDISVRTGERVIVLVVDAHLEEHFGWKPKR